MFKTLKRVFNFSLRSRDRERGKGSSTLRRARRESTTKLYTETHTQQDEENNSLHENRYIIKKITKTQHNDCN